MNKPDNEHAHTENVQDYFRQVQHLLEEQAQAETLRSPLICRTTSGTSCWRKCCTSAI